MRPPRPPRVRTPKPPRPAKARTPMPRSAPQAQFTSAPRGRAGSDLAGVVAQSLFGTAPGVIEMTIPTPTPEPATPEGDAAMKPTVGSVLQYTPDARGWIANLTDEDGNEWAEPVVGWAVVVTWAGYASDDEAEREGQPDEFQTEVQPVLFVDSGLELLMFREGVALEGLTMPGQIG